MWNMYKMKKRSWRTSWNRLQRMYKIKWKTRGRRSRMGKVNAGTREKRMWRMWMRAGFRFLASADSKLSVRVEHGKYKYIHTHTHTAPPCIGKSLTHMYVHTRNTKPDEWSAPNYGIKLNWFWYPTISFTDSFPLCEQPLSQNAFGNLIKLLFVLFGLFSSRSRLLVTFAQSSTDLPHKRAHRHTHAYLL